MRFTANPTAGKVVEWWEINDRVRMHGNNNNNPNQLITRLNPAYLHGASEATITYTERDKEQLTIKFTNSNIKCIKLPDNTEIASGTQVLEGTRLRAETKDGTNVYWRLNGNSVSSYPPANFLEGEIFKLNDENTITISYEE